jgi:hypothetical protein
MSKALTIFNTPQPADPSYVDDIFGEERNINDRVTVPALSYEGKVWTMSVNGEKTKVTKRTDDGDVEPVSTMRVVVLDYAKRRGRAYYEGSYDPSKPGSPLCWSDDGIKPHPAVTMPKCGTCDGCPMAVKGSKITDQGKAVTACSQHRMIVVVPAGKLDFTPMRMKLAITSDWDKNSPELEQQGWFAFNNYTDFLRTKNVPHTAAIVTKMKFDPNVPYPKVMFSPDRWLEADELAQIKPVVRSDAVKNLLGGTYTPAGVDGKKIAEAEDADVVVESPKPAVKKAAATSVIEEDDEDEIVVKPKPAAKKAAVVMDDDDDEVEVKPAAKKAEPKAEPKKAAAKAAEPEASGKVPEDVADLLAEWGED